jgi:hypothetical protein
LGKGTVFAVSTDATVFTKLYDFTGGSDATLPYGGLILSGNTLYGTARGSARSDSSASGKVFSLSFATQLTITPSGANVVLAWQTNFAGFDYNGFNLQARLSSMAHSPTWSA